MLNKTIIESLESYKYELQFYGEKTKDLEKIRHEMDKCQIVICDKQAKHTDSSIEEIRYDNLKRKYNEELSKLNTIESKKNFIESEIEKLPQPYKNILFLRYIKSHSFDEIAAKMSYSSKRIYQLHKEALKLYCEQQESMISLN